MLAVVESSAILGVDAYGVRVEVNVTTAQLPQITIVGLPDAAVQESKERVRAAIKNSGLSFPGDKKITITLHNYEFPYEAETGDENPEKPAGEETP